MGFRVLLTSYLLFTDPILLTFTESSPLGSVSAPQELPRDPVSLATFNGGYSQPNDDNSSDRGGRTDPPEEDGDDEEAMNGLKTKKRKQKSMYKGGTLIEIVEMVVSLLYLGL